MSRLRRRGAQPATIARQPAFGYVAHLATPVADAIGERLLGVPFHPGLAEAAIEEIAVALGSAFGCYAAGLRFTQPRAMATNPETDKIRFDVDAARERVALRMPEGPVTLGAPELERLAQQLGDLRASMTPEVGASPPEGSCPALDKPLFAAQLVPDHSRVALGVRMPTLGWVALMLYRGQVEGLGRYFTEVASKMAPRAH